MKDKLIKEKQELDARLHKLFIFGESGEFGMLPYDERLLLCRQQASMQTYSDVLEIRIDKFEQQQMPQCEMPRYKCHKEVWALKIAEIERHHHYAPETGQGAAIVPVEEGYGAFSVDEEYMTKHNPTVGGYYVVYADGYKSFSPAEAFEDGYTLI